MTCACASPLIARGDFVVIYTVGRVVPHALSRTYRDQHYSRNKMQLEIGGLGTPRQKWGTRPPRYEFMEIGETLYVTNGKDFRTWLERNHKSKKEIWLIQYKKAAKKPSINYIEAVEEAICFGWIDGLEKSMDAERYALRFSPRRPKSNWTETNKERARKLIAQGKMTESGRATLPPDVNTE